MAPCLSRPYTSPTKAYSHRLIHERGCPLSRHQIGQKLWLVDTTRGDTWKTPRCGCMNRPWLRKRSPTKAANNRRARPYSLTDSSPASNRAINTLAVVSQALLRSIRLAQKFLQPWVSRTGTTHCTILRLLVAQLYYPALAACCLRSNWELVQVPGS